MPCPICDSNDHDSQCTDREAVRAAVGKDGRALWPAPDELKADKDVFEAAKASMIAFVGQNGLNKVLLLIGRVNVAMAVLHLVLVASDVAPVGLSVVDSMLGLRSVVLVVTVSMRISMLSIHVAEFTTVEGLV